MAEIKIGNNLEKLEFKTYIKQENQPEKEEIDDSSVYDYYITQFEDNKINNGCFQDAAYTYDEEKNKYYCSGYTDNFGELNYSVAYDYNIKGQNFDINLKNIDLIFLKKRYYGTTSKIKLSITINNNNPINFTLADSYDSQYSFYKKILSIKPPDTYATTSNYSFSIRGEYERSNSTAFREDIWTPIFLDYQDNNNKNLLFYRKVNIGKGTAKDYDNDKDANASNNIETDKIEITLPIPIREGYKFLHWNTKKDNTGTPYEKGQKFSSETPTTLYAIWEKERNFTPYVKKEDRWVKAKAVYVNKNYGTNNPPNWVEVKNVFEYPYN